VGAHLAGANQPHADRTALGVTKRQRLGDRAASMMVGRATHGVLLEPRFFIGTGPVAWTFVLRSKHISKVTTRQAWSPSNRPPKTQAGSPRSTSRCVPRGCITSKD